MLWIRQYRTLHTARLLAGTYELRKYLGVSTARDATSSALMSVGPASDTIHGEVLTIKKEELNKKKPKRKVPCSALLDNSV